MVLSVGTPSRDRTMGIHVSCYEKVEGQMRRRDQAPCPEGLVLDEPEKHLILNSNRFQTFENARLEIVTYWVGGQL